ncbi:FKBP-type peptidyl-prolyl cis-trans isomerase FklB [Moraxella cuniculi DSM 21768]|uniref:Peptidyl-prolyl cis-trans isomerase n=1 Tax=Moraxella cuniculi DSM 21768 TaxID=1122245 RepID=A0A1N7EDM9_9GAMM|nr:FKBP-type peptidyl-prolyl cis-trans isomerase [Moraxella cuniculi]OOS05327.1 peptidylprolyl isomerase [Moraxella cuniculi]SIR86129.1 FKBP-type peptidyl-prolyl cis-trans isomerase FklB [Moraxella cuniculi DSM 21768]
MKKHALVAAIIAAVALTGCNKDTKAGDAKADDKKAAVSKVINEKSTEMQKVSFVLGYNTGKDLKMVDEQMDLEVFYKALKDGFEGKESPLSEDDVKKLGEAYEARKKTEAEEKLKQTAAKNKVDGEKFLTDNAKKQGVQTTASGLQYKVITEGTGKSPTANDGVLAAYEGKLIDGTVFDSSEGQPVPFMLNQVIKGWTEGLQLMKEGGKYELYVPAALAYGEEDLKEIPPNSVLIFQIDLKQVLNAKAVQAEQQKMQQEMIKQLQEAQANQ